MVTVVARAEVYEIQLDRQFQIGGQGFEYGKRLQREIYTKAVATAPVGPPRVGHKTPVGWSGVGNLKRSHVNRGMLYEGRYRCRGTIANVAPYAAAVHNGRSAIFKMGNLNENGQGGGGLQIPTSSILRYAPGLAPQARRTYVYLRHVGPGKANPWLDNAGHSIARGA